MARGAVRRNGPRAGYLVYNSDVNGYIILVLFGMLVSIAIYIQTRRVAHSVLWPAVVTSMLGHMIGYCLASPPAQAKMVPWLLISLPFGMLWVAIPSYVALIPLRIFLRSKKPPPPEDGLPHCAKCGYILHGTSAPRCPECGTGFDAEMKSATGPTIPQVMRDSQQPGTLNKP